MPDSIFVTTTIALKILGEAGVKVQRVTLHKNLRRHEHKIFGRVYYRRNLIEKLLEKAGAE